MFRMWEILTFNVMRCKSQICTKDSKSIFSNRSHLRDELLDGLVNKTLSKRSLKYSLKDSKLKLKKRFLLTSKQVYLRLQKLKKKRLTSYILLLRPPARELGTGGSGTAPTARGGAATETWTAPRGVSSSCLKNKKQFSWIFFKCWYVCGWRVCEVFVFCVSAVVFLSSHLSDSSL